MRKLYPFQLPAPPVCGTKVEVVAVERVLSDEQIGLEFRGARLCHVAAGSPALTAGCVRFIGCRCLKVNSRPVATLQEIRDACTPGTLLNVFCFEVPTAGTRRVACVRLETRMGQSFTYSGDVSESGRPEGVGIAEYDDDERYEGQFHRGMRDGEGTYYYSNGDIYDGPWRTDYCVGAAHYFWRKRKRWDRRVYAATRFDVVAEDVPSPDGWAAVQTSTPRRRVTPPPALGCTPSAAGSSPAPR
eukprot:TRINITY_DN15444_c0_g1_i1.p1 TRINITY_DN15444_c0_g1~~TRINITY_DN15444_c0_g1_i1.p1  ORF type:complete len:244 (+),score=49.37 TRINITY_DN15444_c0_g1_i1:310-1041(+)